MTRTMRIQCPETPPDRIRLDDMLSVEDGERVAESFETGCWDWVEDEPEVELTGRAA